MGSFLVKEGTLGALGALAELEEATREAILRRVGVLAFHVGRRSV